MYTKYQEFVHNNKDNFLNFKSDKTYNAILEHVSEELGNQYVNIIENLINDSLTQITFENINDYLLLNDKYGNPIKYLFTIKNKPVTCSPTSLRYVCHALIILQHIKFTNSDRVVEVGCGYGGLFLCINHFSKILNIPINKYYIVDLPEICSLIKSYLEKHNDINIDYQICSAYDYGKDIDDENLFFISNYCFTEINKENRDNYICYLMPKVSHGFITWQTVFGLKLSDVKIIGKEILNTVEEYPQTASIANKNHYVYF
jgi:putative sugar O-methyltransferase